VVWRRLHYLNFGVWIAATAHGLGAGTDPGSVWLLSLYAVSTVTVAGLAIRRFGSYGSAQVRPRHGESARLESAKT
jgi:sulfoxide reductase heme-binding subunit YedZ